MAGLVSLTLLASEALIVSGKHHKHHYSHDEEDHSSYHKKSHHNKKHHSSHEKDRHHKKKHHSLLSTNIEEDDENALRSNIMGRDSSFGDVLGQNKYLGDELNEDIIDREEVSLFAREEEEFSHERPMRQRLRTMDKNLPGGGNIYRGGRNLA
jgi:hypothetical protein